MANSLASTGTTAADLFTTTALIPVFTGTLQGQAVQLCDARTLHTFMAVLRDFTTWIKGRIRKFGFVEGIDFITVKNLSSPDLVSAKSRAQTLADYHLSLDMAKELSMVENNAKGREARRYFMECEKQVLAALSAHPTDRIAYSVNPTDTLSAAQAEQLRLIFKEKCDTLPHAEQAGFMTKGWSKLKSHFGCTYRQIQQREFTEALSLASRHASEWQAVGTVVAAPVKNALKALPVAQPTKTLQLMVITTDNGQSTVEMYPASDLPQMVLHMRDVISMEDAQKICSHSSLRMMGEVGRMGTDHTFEAQRKVIRSMSPHQINIIANDAYMEIMQRTIIENEMGSVA